jgi:hypothetical protein
MLSSPEPLYGVLAASHVGVYTISDRLPISTSGVSKQILAGALAPSGWPHSVSPMAVIHIVINYTTDFVIQRDRIRVIGHGKSGPHHSREPCLACGCVLGMPSRMNRPPCNQDLAMAQYLDPSCGTPLSLPYSKSNYGGATRSLRGSADNVKKFLELNDLHANELCMRLW